MRYSHTAVHQKRYKLNAKKPFPKVNVRGIYVVYSYNTLNQIIYFLNNSYIKVRFFFFFFKNRVLSNNTNSCSKKNKIKMLIFVLYFISANIHRPVVYFQNKQFHSNYFYFYLGMFNERGCIFIDHEFGSIRFNSDKLTWIRRL